MIYNYIKDLTNSRKKISIFNMLCSVYSINKSKCLQICSDLGINPNANISTLAHDVSFIMEILDSYIELIARKESISTFSVFKIDLIKQRQMLQRIKSIQYFRLKRGLPIHGQNTHSNGRTAKKQLNFYEN